MTVQPRPSHIVSLAILLVAVGGRAARTNQGLRNERRVCAGEADIATLNITPQRVP